MPRESVIFGIAGVFFGVLVGWIIGSQQAGPARQIPAVPADAQQQSQQTQTPALDEARVQRLQAAAKENPASASPRVELANLYFDSERFVDAAHWYEEALKLEPRNVDVSTDLGIAYFRMNRPDVALQQFDRSLTIEPGHTKTLWNIGIVRAMAKQDLAGAAKAWERVIELAPTSPEAGRAREALASLRGSHPGIGGGEARPSDRQ